MTIMTRFVRWQTKPNPKSLDDWRDVGFAIKNTGQNENYYKLFDKFSTRNEDKYETKTTKMYWESIRNPLLLNHL